MDRNGLTNSTSSDSLELAVRSKKSRLRLSFVCRNCRKRKIKCDKAQPKCGRCAKLGLECNYDLSEQISLKKTPGRPVTIHEQLEELEHKFEDMRHSLNLSGMRAWNEDLDNRSKPIKINFFVGLQPNCFESIFKRDCKPFSDMGMIQKHKRLNPFLKFVTRSFKPLNYAVKKILQSVGDSLDPHSDELESVAEILFLTPQVREVLKQHSMNPEGITQETANAIRRCLLEKGSRGDEKSLFEPVDLEFSSSKISQAELIDQIVAVLPPRDQIEHLLAYFMKVVYPLVPYVNKSCFFRRVTETIKYSENGKVIGLDIGDYQDAIRKIGCMAIFLVVLRISHTALTLVKNLPYNGEHLDRFISVSQKCLAHLITLSHKTNEDILSCLILMRWSLIYSPTEGEVVAGSVTDMLLSLIVNHAIRIGLYRDRIQANGPKKNDKMERYFIHYRAKLWMGCLILLRSDLFLKGNFPVVSPEYAAMAPKEENPENYEDEAEAQIHRILHKQLDIYSKMSILDKLTLQVEESTDIEEIYSKIRRLEYDLQSYCPLSDVENLNNTTLENTIIQSMNNALYFKVNVMVKIYFLAIRASIVAILERQITEALTDTEHLSLRYREVTAECFESAVDLCEILCAYMSVADDDQNSPVMPDHRYILNQIVQIGIFRVSYYFIGVILTLLQVKNGLENFMWQNENKQSLVTEIEYKITLIESTSKAIFQSVQKLIHLGSHTLSDRYFTSFKQFLFLEYAMQVIQNEINPNTPSRLREVLGDIGLPVAMDYSPSDWEKFASYVKKAIGQDEPTPPFTSSDDIPSAPSTHAKSAPNDPALDSMLLFDDQVNIQNMLDGDYTWTDFI